MVDGTVRFLIEAKAIGISLNDHMVRQIVDYGANLGTDWVLLTNGVKWNLYKIHIRYTSINQSEKIYCAK